MHRGTLQPCPFCQLEARLPELHDYRLAAIAHYVETIPTACHSGELQGRCHVIADELRDSRGNPKQFRPTRLLAGHDEP